MNTIRLTRKLIDAGARVLADNWVVVSDYAADEPADVVFRAML